MHAGMQGVWVNRDDGPWDAFAGQPDLTIGSFHDLHDELTCWSRTGYCGSGCADHRRRRKVVFGTLSVPGVGSQKTNGVDRSGTLGRTTFE